jgi:hypothetical protein
VTSVIGCSIVNRLAGENQMVLAIVRKDLRETRLFAALSLGLYLIYLRDCPIRGTFDGRAT